MQTVTVEKGWLASVVRKNRETHRANFEKAFDGYRRECIRILEQNLDEFRKGARTRIVWTESPPADHTKDYDRVIAMIYASVDENVELTADEFESYVQDDWGWKQSWMTSNSKYL